MSSPRTLRCVPTLVLAWVPALAVGSLVAWLYATDTDHTRQRLDRLAELAEWLPLAAVAVLVAVHGMRCRAELHPGHLELVLLRRQRFTWAAIDDIALRRDRYCWQVEVRVGATRHPVHALTCPSYPRSYREASNGLELRQWFRGQPPPQAPGVIARPYQALREEWLSRR